MIKNKIGEEKNNIAEEEDFSSEEYFEKVKKIELEHSDINNQNVIAATVIWPPPNNGEHNNSSKGKDPLATLNGRWARR